MKNIKPFFNIGKTKASQGTIKKLETENGEFNEQIKINKELRSFFETLLKKRKKTPYEINEILRKTSFPLKNCQQRKTV